MNNLIQVGLIAAFCLSATAKPSITDVKFSQDSVSRCVTISYVLTGGPAIVTLDTIKDNGVNLDPALYSGDIVGEVNDLLVDGNHAIVWRPDRGTWTNRTLAPGRLTAEISAWTTDVPPDYAVVDLVVSNVVRYYSSTNALPGGIGNSAYRQDKLLLRRVPAKDVVWRMGSPVSEVGCLADRREMEIPHYVKLQEDYWIGVFPITMGQMEIFNGALLDYAAFTNVPAYKLCPANYIGYSNARGQYRYGIDWPKSGHTVDRDSLIGKLRRVTGVDGFDLPTDAQWEYACRAGTGEAFPFDGGTNGLTAAGKLAPNYLKQRYWFYRSTTNVTYVAKAGTSAVTGRASMPVGLMPPNGWGLYDMIGNGEEIVLDGYVKGDAYAATFGPDFTPTKIVVDPEGPTNTTGKAVAHGWRSSTPAADMNETTGACYHRSASRMNSRTEGDRGCYSGIRVVCPLGALL